MAVLRPFRTIPTTLREWARWMAEQDFSDADLDVNSVDTDALTADSGTIDALSAGSVTLTDTGWEDITADLSSGKVAGANVPTWSTFRNGISAYEFSASALNELWITFHITHDYKRNTNIYPHIHFSTAATTSSGVVRWGIEYMFAKGHDQEAFPASSTIYLEYTFTANKQYQHIILEASDSQAFGAGAIETDGLLLCRIFRDGAHPNDTFASTVFGLTADIHYQVGQVTTPFKTAPFFR
jgi:hypothetical protein